MWADPGAETVARFESLNFLWVERCGLEVSKMRRLRIFSRFVSEVLRWNL
jgi:hypothetical protein